MKNTFARRIIIGMSILTLLYLPNFACSQPCQSKWREFSGTSFYSLLYPDTYSNYWVQVLDLGLHPVAMTLQGQFPHARYMSFTIYDPDSGGAIGNIVDSDIIPDAHNINPFLSHANRHAKRRNYTIHLIPTHDGPYTAGGLPLIIGKNNTIGHRVTLHACTIGDNCLIGMGSIVMDGAHLESQLILAAGSLVPPGKFLTGGFLWRGSPAIKIRPLSEKELASLPYSANFYLDLKNQYLAENTDDTT